MMHKQEVQRGLVKSCGKCVATGQTAMFLSLITAKMVKKVPSMELLFHLYIFFSFLSSGLAFVTNTIPKNSLN